MLDLSRLSLQKSAFMADIYRIAWLALRADERPIAEPQDLAPWHHRAATLIMNVIPLGEGQPMSPLGRQGLLVTASLELTRITLWTQEHVSWLHVAAVYVCRRHLTAERAALRREIVIANSLISDRMVHLTGAADEAFVRRVEDKCRRDALVADDQAITIEAARWITSTRAVRAQNPWAGAPTRRAKTPAELTPLAIEECKALADTYRVGYLGRRGDVGLVRAPRLLSERHRRAASHIARARTE